VSLDEAYSDPEEYRAAVVRDYIADPNAYTVEHWFGFTALRRKDSKTSAIAAAFRPDSFIDLMALHAMQLI
jgi:hypothetical protein